MNVKTLVDDHIIINGVIFNLLFLKLILNFVKINTINRLKNLKK